MQKKIASGFLTVFGYQKKYTTQHWKGAYWNIPCDQSFDQIRNRNRKATKNISEIIDTEGQLLLQNTLSNPKKRETFELDIKTNV